MEAIYKGETRIWSTLLILDGYGSEITTVQVPIEYAAGYKIGDHVDLDLHHNKRLKNSIIGQLNDQQNRQIRETYNEIQDIKEKNEMSIEAKRSLENKNACAVIAIAIIVLIIMVNTLGPEVTTWVIILAVPIYLILRSIEGS